MNEGRVLYILVNYFNEAEVARFIMQELRTQTINKPVVIVVDNGSNSSLVNNLPVRNLVVFNPGDNLGYFGAAAFALREFLKKNSLPEFVILSNADMKFKDKDVLKNLLSSSPADADVIGPALVSSTNNKSLNPFYENRISASKLKFLITVFSFYPLYCSYQLLSLVYGKMKANGKAKAANSHYVYALHGSMLVFRKAFFEKGGSLEYGGFLFSEELYVAETARERSMKLYLNSSVSVLHDEHTTTGVFKKPKYVRWMRDSLSFIFKTYFR
jgi:GT2 family glycosyltransferase